jgi:hypothetical protein
MNRYPVEPRKRRFLELFIRTIDIVVYFAVLTGGIYAMFFTPDSITKQLAGWEWLVPWWACFLMFGGLLGVIGRSTTIWILEPAADVAASVGILIYLVVLAHTAFDTITSTVATFLVGVAFLAITRRYLELQLFGSDPSHRDFRSRLFDVMHRRIPNVPSRG